MKSKIDTPFIDFIVYDQLSSLNIEARKMFGGHGLYLNGIFVAIIHNGVLFLKTSDKTRDKFIDAGMKPFQPNQKQTLKSYYQVPGEVVEDADMLKQWLLEVGSV